MNKDKFMIVKNKAGLGNRLIHISSSILYAQITGRKLIIDWRDATYSTDGSNVFPKLFTVPNISQVEEIPHTDSVYPLIWKNNLDKSVNDLLRSHDADRPLLYRSPFLWSKYRIDMASIDYPYDCLVSWSYNSEIYKLRPHFKGKFASLKAMSNEAILRKILRENLTLNETIKNQVNTFKKNNFGKKTIGVHIRYTDRKNPFDKYPKIINNIIDKYPQAIIFLATDNKVVELFFREMYKDIVVTAEKWYPESSERLHENWDCPDRFENCVQALVDMYLLASCNYLLCDQNSTLAFAAKLISDIPEVNVIDTSQYSLKRILKKMFV
jgi:hypothetical protein